MNLLFWILFVISISIVEAFMFHSRILEKSKVDVHIPLTINRIIVFAGLFYGIKPIEFLIYCVSCVFTFPFIHDGIYYLTRNILNPEVYKKRFKDVSTTTSAKFSYNFKNRSLLFIFGCILLIILKWI